MRLAVSMIVRNEESCLATALASVVGADELVVVDTSLPGDPPDRTREIALEHGAKLFEFPWCDDFAAARNASLAHCTGEWVLVVDADEVLEGGIAAARAAIAAAPAEAPALGVDCRGADGVAHHVSPRLFRRRPDIKWRGAVHNWLTLDMAAVPPCDVVVTYGYSPAHKADPDRAMRILTKELERDPKLVREAYYLGREHWYRKQYVEAARWFADYLTRATWAPEMADAWLYLARCLWAEGQPEVARRACLQAIVINADFGEALRFMADLSGPKNRERWKLWSFLATDEDVLFVRSPVAQPDLRAAGGPGHAELHPGGSRKA